MRTALFCMLSLLYTLTTSAQNASVTHGDSVKRDVRIYPAPKIGPLTISGICLVSTGPVVTLAGVITAIRGAQKTADHNPRQIRTGEIIAGTGIAMTMSGIAMCIVGGIRDHRRPKKTSFSIVAPGSNEVGLAWNFQ